MVPKLVFNDLNEKGVIIVPVTAQYRVDKNENSGKIGVIGSV